jgi:CheY-like chemotaxis protein
LLFLTFVLFVSFVVKPFLLSTARMKMPVNDKPRVLIVDDEPGLRELLSDALGEELEVSVASSGQEALASAQASQPDLLVTDFCLGDCTGLEVIDSIRQLHPDMPAVLITGHPELASLTETSRRRPVEVFDKPLDLPRLKQAIASELARLADHQRVRTRTVRLRRLARHFKLQGKHASSDLPITPAPNGEPSRPRETSGNADMVSDYRKLNRQVNLQKLVMEFQRNLLLAGDDDDVFKCLFGMFVHHSGPLFGAALVCDDQAQLQLIGRFGVPNPDGPKFCLALSAPIIETVLTNPRPTLIDATEQAGRFDPNIRRYLVGLSILAVPLIPTEGQMIGLVLLYRKGEQPFMESDVALAEMVALPTALAVQRND